ncbi:MAG: tyrosine-protein phosphatase [Paracoccaceae bacterium]
MCENYPCSGPLRCDAVLKVGPASLLLTHLPGRSHVDGQGRVWARDLESDLKALKVWGAEVVICLVEPAELTAMGVPDYVETLRKYDFSLFHLPIRDMSIPGQPFEDAWAQHANELTELLSGPSHIVVHCAAGLGRTGMFCAEMLVRVGCSAEDAIQKVRGIRLGAIETEAQEHYVSAMSNKLDVPLVAPVGVVRQT